MTYAFNVRPYQPNVDTVAADTIAEQVFDAMVSGESMPQSLPDTTDGRVRELFQLPDEQAVDIERYLRVAENVIRTLDTATERYDARMYVAGLSKETLDDQAPTHMRSVSRLYEGMKRQRRGRDSVKITPVARKKPQASAVQPPKTLLPVVVHRLPASVPLEQLSEGQRLQVFGLPEDTTWQDRSVCAQVDSETFFPEKGGTTKEAKKICRGCDVRSECLEYALEHDERHGVWGGLSERERRRLKRRAL